MDTTSNPNSGLKPPQKRHPDVAGPDVSLTRSEAHAKINLYLHVTGKRPDGYHLLDSLAVFAAVHDVVELAPAPTLSLAIGGPFGAGLAAESDNLVLRAARALAQATGATAGAALTLTKNLPVASGIGGGSADAAAALRLLAAAWGVEIPPGLAATLGADVPVCLASRPCRMEGVGERLTPHAPLPPCGLVLVNPGVAVATPSVFKARRAPFSERANLPDQWPAATALAATLATLSNDLQTPAEALCPPITAVLTALRADPRLPARPHERLRRHLLRPLSDPRGGARGIASASPTRLVVLGRLFTLSPPAPNERCAHGASPSGKAADFDSAMRRFESSRPSQVHRRKRPDQGAKARCGDIAS